MNRVHPWPGAGEPPPDDPAEAAAAERWLANALAAADPGIDAAASARALVGAARAQAALARRDARVRAQLEAALPLEADALTQVPLFAEDVHALDGLARIADAIFGRLDHG